MISVSFPVESGSEQVLTLNLSPWTNASFMSLLTHSQNFSENLSVYEECKHFKDVKIPTGEHSPIKAV